MWSTIIICALFASKTLALESEPCKDYSDQACIRNYLASVSDCAPVDPANAITSYAWMDQEIFFDSFNCTAHRFLTTGYGYETAQVTKLMTNEETGQTLIEVTIQNYTIIGDENVYFRRPGLFDHVIYTTFNANLFYVSITAIYDGIEIIDYESERLYTYFNTLPGGSSDFLPEFTEIAKTDPIANVTLGLALRDISYMMREEFNYVSVPYFYGYRTGVLCA